MKTINQNKKEVCGYHSDLHHQERGDGHHLHFDYKNKDIFCYKCNSLFSDFPQSVGMQAFRKHVATLFREYTAGQDLRLFDYGEYQFLLDLNEKLKMKERAAKQKLGQASQSFESDDDLYTQTLSDTESTGKNMKKAQKRTKEAEAIQMNIKNLNFYILKNQIGIQNLDK